MGKTTFNYGLIFNGDEETIAEMKAIEKEKYRRKNIFVKFLILLSSIFAFNIIMFELNTPEIKQENIYQEIYERTGN
jgi:hypothetical protein